MGREGCAKGLFVLSGKTRTKLLPFNVPDVDKYRYGFGMKNLRDGEPMISFPPPNQVP